MARKTCRKCGGPLTEGLCLGTPEHVVPRNETECRLRTALRVAKKLVQEMAWSRAEAERALAAIKRAERGQ